MEDRCRRYAAHRGSTLIGFLGGGNDGDVWKSNQNTAIKAFYHEKNFRMELGCYQRLKSHDIRKILGLTVPQLVAWADSERVVEVNLVSPPYLIDFGKAYLDHAPEHSPETWQDYDENQMEIWGERYGDVQAVLWKLKALGILYRDANPRNINFESQREP